MSDTATITAPATHEETKPATTGEVHCSGKLCEANKLVKHYTYWAAGVGIVPVPLLDFVAVAGVQVKMLSELSEKYGVKFSKQKAQKIIAVLIASVGAPTLLTGTVASVVKIVPIIGVVAGNLAFSVVASASTYALGKVFIQHFESGGTFLDFDPAETRAYYYEKFKEGQKLAADAKQTARMT